MRSQRLLLITVCLTIIVGFSCLGISTTNKVDKPVSVQSSDTLLAPRGFPSPWQYYYAQAQYALYLRTFNIMGDTLLPPRGFPSPWQYYYAQAEYELYLRSFKTQSAKDTGAIDGYLTANFIPKAKTAHTIGNSHVFDNGVNVSINNPSLHGETTSSLLVWLGTVADVLHVDDSVTNNILVSIDKSNDNATFTMYNSSQVGETYLTTSATDNNYFLNCVAVGGTRTAGEYPVSPFVMWLDATKTRVDVLDAANSNWLFTFNNVGHLGIEKLYNSVGSDTTTVELGNINESPVRAKGLPVFINNAAAVLGGLHYGDFYRTGADPDIVCVVH